VNAAKTKTGAGDWRKKLHPVFFELADCNKEFEARFAELQEKATHKLSSEEPSPSTEAKKTVADEYWKGVAALDSWYEERLMT
jgi:hypothetical protein